MHQGTCVSCILVLEFLFTVSFLKKVQMTSVIKGIKSWGNTGLYIRQKKNKKQKTTKKNRHKNPLRVLPRIPAQRFHSTALQEITLTLQTIPKNNTVPPVSSWAVCQSGVARQQLRDSFSLWIYRGRLDNTLEESCWLLRSKGEACSYCELHRHSLLHHQWLSVMWT